MRKIVLTVASLALAGWMVPSTAGAAPLALDSEIDKGSYLMGYSSGMQILQRLGPVVDKAALQAGFAEALAGQASRVSQTEAEAAFQVMSKALDAKLAEAGAAAGKAGDQYRAENAKRVGVKTTASGLQYEILKAGAGPADKKVKTHYHGMLTDGSVFDSSVDRGEPVSFPVNGVIKGWIEALTMMPVGSKWRLVIPPNLAYGEAGSPPAIPPSATLVFEVELLAIE
jgi:FKBP-type peptidyl-prolyl cis-trans isomerase FklB